MTALNQFKTEQEAFWAGDFGTQYIARNQGDAPLASNLHFFSKALRSARDIKSCIEFGANIVMNLKALKLLSPGLDGHAIEINAEAAKQLGENTTPLRFTTLQFWHLRHCKPGVWFSLKVRSFISTLPSCHALMTNCKQPVVVIQ